MRLIDGFISFVFILASGTAHATYLGTPVSPKSPAWKSAVRMDYYERASGNFNTCSGVMLAPDLILTAAHCDVGSKDLVVHFFKENEPWGQSAIVSKAQVAIHPRFAMLNLPGQPYLNDLEIIVTKDSILPEGFEPSEIRSPDSIVAPGDPVMAVGSGLNEKNQLLDKLFYVEGVIERNMAGNSVSLNFRDPSTHRLTGVCGGDSGGPVFEELEGKLSLLGVISNGERNIRGRCGSHIYINEISAERWNWIQSQAKTLRTSLANE